MLELLKKLKDSGTEVGFLFPSTPGTLVGRVEAIEDDKVTIIVERGGAKYRFVTHPENIVLTEKVSG